MNLPNNDRPGRLAPDEIRMAFNRHYLELLRFAQSRLPGREEEAADLVQDLFLLLVARPDAWQRQSSLKTWLFAVLRNRIADTYRRICRQSNWFQPGIDEPAASPVHDPAFSLERDFTACQVQRALLEIPEASRVCLVMKYLDGLCLREIARLIHRSEKACESLLHRSRQAFMNAWEKGENNHGTQ